MLFGPQDPQYLNQLAEGAIQAPPLKPYLNAQAAKEARNRKGLFQQRKKFREMVANVAPDPSHQSTFSKFEHLAGLTPEGLAA